MPKEFIHEPDLGQAFENEESAEVTDHVKELADGASKDEVEEKYIQYIFAAAEMSFGSGQNPAKKELLGLFVKDIDEKYRKLIKDAGDQAARDLLEKSMVKEKNDRLRKIAADFNRASLNDDRLRHEGNADELCHSVKKLWEEMKKANPELTDELLIKIKVENQKDINNGLRSDE